MFTCIHGCSLLVYSRTTCLNLSPFSASPILLTLICVGKRANNEIVIVMLRFSLCSFRFSSCFSSCSCFSYNLKYPTIIHGYTRCFRGYVTAVELRIQTVWDHVGIVYLLLLLPITYPFKILYEHTHVRQPSDEL